MWWLGGRFVSATWDTAELVAREIQAFEEGSTIVRLRMSVL